MREPLPESIDRFRPPYEADQYTEDQQEMVAPFFSNLDSSVYVPYLLSPEVIGALCSRTSRAAGDLREVFLREYLLPFLEPVRKDSESVQEWNKKLEYRRELQEFISFIQKHPLEKVLANPRARSFYAKWLAQYGDDSIAQMAGAHIVYSSLSMVATKHLQDQRIGLAPIEKSTRYVDYSAKVAGRYRYYTDPRLHDWGLEREYRAAMDGLFDSYTEITSAMKKHLEDAYPDETKSVIAAKAFDAARGLLPLSTLTQTAYFGNGQAFEYMITRCLKHPLGEVRWAGERAFQELSRIVPAFLRRIKTDDEQRRKIAEEYQTYIAERGARVAPFSKVMGVSLSTVSGPQVKLVEYDPEAEIKIAAGILFDAPGNERSWAQTLAFAKDMPTAQLEQLFDAYFAGRAQRWQKVGRALENAYVRFEIVMNIGAWRDLHRHRMHSQQRQLFTVSHGFDVPEDIQVTGLAEEYVAAISRAEAVFHKIAERDLYAAQYATCMAHRVRFQQWQNLRAAFWEIELRTIPEGHVDYRVVEQEKYKQLARVYPLLSRYMRVNLDSYEFARRGQEERISAKELELKRL